MVTDQEPRYRLVDADGSVVGSLFAESDGTLKLQEGTSGNENELSFGPQGLLNVQELSVAATSVSTAIADLSSISTGQYESIIGAPSRDANSEISNGQFTPKESGVYRMLANVTLLTADGNEVQLRVRNVSQGITVSGGEIVVGDAAGFRDDLTLAAEFSLISGDSYEIQATDINGSWGTDSGRGRVSISRVIGQ